MMSLICAWCPECLAKRPDVKIDDMCPDHRMSEARAERLSVGFKCSTYHHPELWDGPPAPSPNRRARKSRKPRPKKSQR